MLKIKADIRPPIAVAFASYVSAQAALFAVIGMLALPMPGLWWSLLSIPIAMIMCNHLRRLGHQVLSGYVAMYATGFAGGAVGAHGRDMYCAVAALL